MELAPLKAAGRAAAVLACALTFAIAPAAQVTFLDASDRIPFLRSGGSGLGGAALLDYDNDGDLDVFLTNGQGSPSALLQNDGRGNFIDVALEAGVAGVLGNSGVVAGDLDNDGWTDLFLTGEGGLMGAEQSPTRLYRNLGDGTFEDVSAAAGVPGAETSFSAALVDLDGDGLLDIFVASPGSLATGVQHSNKLYRNRGGMRFADYSTAAGIDTSLGACAVSCTDYDRDGRQDILVGVCNDVSLAPTPFELFHNEGGMAFTDTSTPLGLTRRGFWMCLAFGDIDNDGRIDVFATNLGTAGFPTQRHALYRRTANGGWTDIGVQAGVADWEFGWGGTLADFDNDGDLDLFYAGSLPVAPFNIVGPGRGSPGRLFFNDGEGGFTQTAGTQPRNMSSMFTSGVVQGDLDGNGFPDILVVTHELSDVHLGRPVLLLNEGNERHWITFRPIGTLSNRGAVGAFLEVWAGDKRGRQVREVRAGSSILSSETPWPSFGLGRATRATVRITWPSGKRQVFRNLAADQVHTLIEGQRGAERTPVPD